MPTTLYAGTSGWAYTSWKPGFYPPDLPPRRFLPHYASRLNSVEVNATFRRLPTQKHVADWLKQVADSPGFRFSFKVPEQITHRARLRACSSPWQALLTALQPVTEAGRLGAVLLQFPPNFRAASKGKDKLLNGNALAAFLDETHSPTRPRLALEFRDSSWFTPETYTLLRRHNAALCWADADTLHTPREQTADFLYLRLRQSAYTPAELSHERDTLRQQASAADVFCYYKHEEAPDGPLRAEALLCA